MAFEVGERLGVAGIGQLVEVDDGLAFFFDKETNEVGSDEAGSAGD